MKHKNLPSRYRMPLCPYLIVGNQRIMVHLDAYGVPQSLNWPYPGSPDRLGWRDRFDEWPYWEEMDKAAIAARMPRIDNESGSGTGLHEAVNVSIDYIEDTNILEGVYELPDGSKVELTTFTPPERDVWIRHYRIEGRGFFVLQEEFFSKAVRGHAFAHLGDAALRGGLDADPQGVYTIFATVPLETWGGRTKIKLDGVTEFTIYLAFGTDLENSLATGQAALAAGFEKLLKETVDENRAWISRAREPLATHSFVRNNYRRWLLVNRMLLCENGAMVCGARPFWTFVWPRDGSQQIVALAKSGFVNEAARAVRWLLEQTPQSGIHEARYWSSGGPVLLDNRRRQGDNPGFLCWAAGEVAAQEWNQEWVDSIREPLTLLADHLIQNADPETGLPLPEADHRETQVSQSIGIAVTAFGGLMGVAKIFERLGDNKRAAQCIARAAQIRNGADRFLWNEKEKYCITSINPRLERVDIATAWAVFPFELWPGDNPRSRPAVSRLVNDRWNTEAGGVLSGAGTAYESYWMYYAAKLLLGVAGTGDRALVDEILDALEKNSSPQGLVPEQVSRATGNLWGCAPLPTAQSSLLIYAYSFGY